MEKLNLEKRNCQNIALPHKILFFSSLSLGELNINSCQKVWVGKYTVRPNKKETRSAQINFDITTWNGSCSAIHGQYIL